MKSFSLTVAQKSAMKVLISAATFISLGGGSRSGKTFLLLRAVIIRAIKSPGSRHAVFRFRFNAVKNSIVLDTLPKVMKLCFPDLFERCNLDKTDWYLRLPNGSEIWFCGLDDKERTEKILGMEFATIYYNECSQIPYAAILLSLTRLAQKTENLKLKAYFDFNPPSKRHWTYLRFIKKVNPETGRSDGLEDEYEYYLINPEDNKDNLDPQYIKMLKGLPERTRKRFLLGQFSDDDDKALWTDEILSKCRILGRVDEKIPQFKRVVIAVDPSGTDGKDDNNSDEIGIAVCGLGSDGDGYLIEDLSGNHSPAKWGKVVADAYERHGADRVVAEKNFGGAMVESVVRSANANISYTGVTASRGKIARAEPISALYEQERIHHIGFFQEIEDQLLAMTTDGYVGLKSPDRADAMIWGFSHLFNQMVFHAEVKEVDMPQAFSYFNQ